MPTDLTLASLPRSRNIAPDSESSGSEDVQCSTAHPLATSGRRFRTITMHTYMMRILMRAMMFGRDDNRFTYRDIITALPPSLKRLQATNAHGPNIRVAATFKKSCPQPEELRPGRCTMFNRIPACDFWASFPHARLYFPRVRAMALSRMTMTDSRILMYSLPFFPLTSN